MKTVREEVQAIVDDAQEKYVARLKELEAPQTLLDGQEDMRKRPLSFKVYGLREYGNFLVKEVVPVKPYTGEGFIGYRYIFRLEVGVSVLFNRSELEGKAMLSFIRE